MTRINVRPVVPDHPGTGSLRPGDLQDVEKRAGVRLQREPGIRADNGGKKGIRTEFLQDMQRGPVGLVGEDGQKEPGCFQCLQSVQHTRIKPRFHDKMRVVFVPVTPERFVQIQSGCIRGRTGNQNAGAVSDHADDGSTGERRKAEGSAHAVRSGSDVSGGVDQRAVHVERNNGFHGWTLSNQMGMVWFSGRRAWASRPGGAVTPRFQ